VVRADLNFFRPVQIVNDVWRAGGSSHGTPLVGFWWAAFLIAGWMGTIASSMVRNGGTPEDIRSGSATVLVSDVFRVMAAVLALLIVIEATRRLDEHAATAPEPAPPTPQWPPPDAPPPAPGEAFPSYPS
jgi:uncharacterized protein DUF4328